jgi:hypothetical protein
MAIFAEITHRRLNAAVSYRQLVSSASLEKASIHVHTTQTFALANYQDLVSQINYQHLYANTNWQRLLLANVKINAEKTIFTFADNVAFSDQALLHIQPAFAEQIDLSDSINEFVVSKGLSDAQSLTDATQVSSGKALTEIFSFNDSINEFDFGKGLSDSQSFTETHFFAVGASLADSFTWQDQLSFDSSATLADSFGFTEAQAFDQDTTRSDSTAIQDSLVKGVGRGVADDFEFEENTAFVRNPFNFSYVFDGEDASVHGRPTDSFSFDDALSFAASMALSDAFTLDDFAQVDKHATGVKSNLLSVTDEAVSNFSKVVENQTFSFTEEQEFALSKPILDSIIGMEDSPAFFASRQVSDSYDIEDAIVLSPRIGSSDSFNVTDELEHELRIHGSLLNKGLIGNVLLNAQ